MVSESTQILKVRDWKEATRTLQTLTNNGYVCMVATDECEEIMIFYAATKDGCSDSYGVVFMPKEDFEATIEEEIKYRYGD